MKSKEIAQLIQDMLGQDLPLGHPARSRLLDAVGKTVSVSDLVYAIVDLVERGIQYHRPMRTVASILLEADGGSGRLISGLLDLFDNPSPVVRSVVIRIMQEMAWMPGLEIEWVTVREVIMLHLIAALEHEDPMVQVNAINALGYIIVAEDAIPALLMKTTDPNISVREAARMAVSYLLPERGEIDGVIQEFWLQLLSDEEDLPDLIFDALGSLNRQQISGLARCTAENFDRVNSERMLELIRQCFIGQELPLIALLVEVFRRSSPDARRRLWVWLQNGGRRVNRPGKRPEWPDNDHAVILREAMDDPDPEVRYFATTIAKLAGYV